MKNRRRPRRLGLLAAAIVFVAGLAFAGTASARPVPVTGYRLAAVLRPTSAGVSTRAQGRFEAQVVQDHRTKIEDEAACVLQGGVDHALQP